MIIFFKKAGLLLFFFFNFPFLFRKMTRGNGENNHLKGIPLQKFFVKLNPAFPPFSPTFYILKRKEFGMCQLLFSLLHKASAFSNCRRNAMLGLISQTSGFNQVHGVPGWRALGDSC